MAEEKRLWVACRAELKRTRAGEKSADERRGEFAVLVPAREFLVHLLDEAGLVDAVDEPPHQIAQLQRQLGNPLTMTAYVGNKQP